MQVSARPVTVPEIDLFRDLFRAEMNCQIVHDNMHYREGWTQSYLLEIDAAPAGYGSILIGGPWKGTRTLFEFFVLPDRRSRAFDLFERLLASSEATAMEIQSNDALITVMLHAYAHNIVTEKIVFADQITTHLSLESSGLPHESIVLGQRGEPDNDWILEADGELAASGGILYHYNRPYGDIYMKVAESFRRHGFGSYLVQELKRICYERGSIPAARCDPDNFASRKTLQKAGFVPCAHILIGKL